MPHSGTRGGSLTRLLEQEFPPDASFGIDIPPPAYDPYRRASFPIYEGFERSSHLENPVIPPYPYNPTPTHLPVVRPYLSDHSEKKCCVVILLVLLVLSIPTLLFLYESSRPFPRILSNQ